MVVFSVAVPDGVLRPRGCREAEGFVLPAYAVDEPLLREWLESAEHRKVAHNCRYDRHVFANAGIDVQGLVDTVDIFRLVMPGRERYGLKHLVPDLLGWSMYGDFEDVFSEPVVKTTVKHVRFKVCVVHGRTDNGNRRWCEFCDEELVVVERDEVQTKTLKTRRRISLQEICQIPQDRWEIRPGEHPLWQRFVDYAGADAVGAAQLYQTRKDCYEGFRKARVPCT